MSDDRRSLNSLDDIEFAVGRIEELEDALSLRTNLHQECIHLLQSAEAKLAKAVDAVDVELIEQAISDVLSEGGTYRDAAEYVARTTLAELKGDSDEK